MTNIECSGSGEHPAFVDGFGWGDCPWCLRWYPITRAGLLYWHWKRQP